MNSVYFWFGAILYFMLGNVHIQEPEACAKHPSITEEMMVRIAWPAVPEYYLIERCEK